MIELLLHSIKLESYSAWTQNRYQQLTLEYKESEQFTEWCKESNEEGKRCFNWSGKNITFSIDKNGTDVIRILIYGKGLLVQKVLLGEEILNIREKIQDIDDEIISFSIGIKNQSRKANIIIAKLFFRFIIIKENKLVSANIKTEEIKDVKAIVIEEVKDIKPLIIEESKDDKPVIIEVPVKSNVDYEKYKSLLGLISIEAIEHKMLMDGIPENDINSFISIHKEAENNQISIMNKPPPPPPPRPPPPPPKLKLETAATSNTTTSQNTIPSKPPPPPKPPVKLETPIIQTPTANDNTTSSDFLSSSLCTEDGESLTNKTPFVIAKRKEKVKDYTHVKGFRENIEMVLYSAEAQCAQLEAVLSFNEVSVSEIMIKIETFSREIRTLIDRDIVKKSDKCRLNALADNIEITLSSNPPLHANSKYQHLDKMRLLNQRSKDTNLKLNQLLTYLSQSSLSQLFIDSLDKEIETNNIGHFSSLNMIKSKLDLLYRNLSTLSLKLTNLLRPTFGLLKVLENRILDSDSNFLTSDFILNYVDTNDGMNIGCLLVRSRSIGLLKSIYAWSSLKVLSQNNSRNHINSNEAKSQRRKSWIQITNNHNNNIETIEYVEANKVYIDDIDFSNPSDLRIKGFTLEQLRLSGCFTDKEIMNAGFAMKELRVNGNLSVADFRAAGLDINACREAGFTPIRLRQGGFDEVQVVRYGGFSIKQLKSSGCDIQRHAIMGFFDSLDGHHWKKKDNWGSRKPLSEWYGIILNGAGDVIKIDLRCNGLRGILPESLIYLTSLEHLDLYNNQIYSPIPEAIKSLTKLKNLWLNDNLFHLSSMEKSILKSHLNKCIIRVD